MDKLDLLAATAISLCLVIAAFLASQHLIWLALWIAFVPPALLVLWRLDGS